MDKTAPASLYIDGQVELVLCEPDGWMTVIASDGSTDYSSLSLSDYSNTGEMRSLPSNVFWPLKLLHAFTANKGVEVKIYL